MQANLQVPLGEQEHLRDFFTMMKDNGRAAQAEDVERLISCMEGMKTEFADAMDEIRYLREQIDVLQNQTMKGKLSQIQQEALYALKMAQEEAISIKKKLDENIQDTVRAVKKKGTCALNKALDIIPVEHGLSAMEVFFKNSMEAMGQRAEMVGGLADEIHAVKGHMKNVGDVMSGKRIQEIERRDDTKGILAKIQKSMDFCRKLIAGLAVKTIMAQAYLEHFRQLSDKKPEMVPNVEKIAESFNQNRQPMPLQFNEAR